MPFKDHVSSNMDSQQEGTLMKFSKAQLPGLNPEVGQQSRRHMLLGNQFSLKTSPHLSFQKISNPWLMHDLASSGRLQWCLCLKEKHEIVLRNSFSLAEVVCGSVVNCRVIDCPTLSENPSAPWGLPGAVTPPGHGPSPAPFFTTVD